MSIRLLEYKIQEGKDMFLVDYPGKGQRWVYSFMIGGQYSEEKSALKFRHDQHSNGSVVVNDVDSSTNPTILTDTDAGVSHTQRIDNVEVRKPPKEVLTCICQQQQAVGGEELVTCSMCRKSSHLRCVRAEGLPVADMKDWQCPFCRILHMDPFNPGFELLMFTTTPRNMLMPTSQDGTLTMRFNVQPEVLKDWQVRRVSLSVRCIGLGPKSLVPHGPFWPREVTASVNSYKDVFKVLPGKYGHVRREVSSKEISDMVKPNSNTVNVSYKTDPPPAHQAQPPRFMFGVVASEPKSKTDILTIIKRLTVDECRERDTELVKAAQVAFDSLQSGELVIETSANFDIVHTRCPLSLCEMATPVRGVDCEHIQCYDADAYIDVNIRTRNVEKRWKCPVCCKIVRPEDLIVDAFLQNECQGEVKRVKLNIALGYWEVLPDEDAEGEGSDDELIEPTNKRTRKSDEEDISEIVLD